MKRRSARVAGDGREGGGDAALALELEVHIRDHGVEPTVAEYVRHVVREGFDAAFDSMDPA
jgi:hypothetical protein